MARQSTCALSFESRPGTFLHNSVVRTAGSCGSGHGVTGRQLPLRLVLRCGVTWQTHRTASLRGHPPRLVAWSHFTVARVWREYNLKPWQIQTFKFSTDPELDAKIHDVVGLYLHPPERAVVLCVDEKSQIQALDRTQPNLPLRPGSPERRTHDYVRHGTTTLFAALEVATGKVTDRCFDRHRHTQFLAFCSRSPAPIPGVSCTSCGRVPRSGGNEGIV